MILRITLSAEYKDAKGRLHLATFSWANYYGYLKHHVVALRVNAIDEATVTAMVCAVRSYCLSIHAACQLHTV